MMGKTLPAQNSSIEVELSGLRNDKGHVLVSIFREESGFPEDATRAVYKVKVDINKDKAIANFNSVPNGVYAISVLHDENDDLKMDKNFVGLPREGYGFSNNVSRLTGPPSFKEASFNHQSKQTILIKLKY